MAVILKLLLVSSCLLALSSAVDIDEEFKKAKLVPDIIEKSPSSLAEVVFADGSTANLGTLLKVSTVATEPKVTWPTIPDSLYTIVYIDADSPAKPPGTNVFIHWLKVNIKAADLGSGVDVYPYLFTLPLPGSPPHRYPVLVYQQDVEIEVDPLANEKSAIEIERYKNFSEYIKNYSNNPPVAGTFFVSRFEALF